MNQRTISSLKKCRLNVFIEYKKTTAKYFFACTLMRIFVIRYNLFSHTFLKNRIMWKEEDWIWYLVR